MTMNPFSRLSKFAPVKGPALAKKGDMEDELDTPEKKDDEDEDDDDKKKNKKSKKADDDSGDDEDEQDDDDPKARAARGRERARIKAIIQSPEGRRSPNAAMSVAFDTALPRGVAIGLLRDMRGESRGGLNERMAAMRQPDIGAGGDEQPALGDSKALGDAIIAAHRKAQGER